MSLSPGQKVDATIREVEFKKIGKDEKPAFVFLCEVKYEPGTLEAKMWVNTPNSKANTVKTLTEFGCNPAKLRGQCVPYVRETLKGKMCKLTMEDEADPKFGLSVKWINPASGGVIDEAASPFDDVEGDGPVAPW